MYGAYDGIIELGTKIYETLRIRKFFTNISRYAELPYTDWWLNQDPHAFERGEKKCTR